MMVQDSLLMKSVECGSPYELKLLQGEKELTFLCTTGPQNLLITKVNLFIKKQYQFQIVQLFKSC